MKQAKHVMLAAVLLCTVNESAFAGDAEKGKAKATICASCHGAQGISSSPLWPNLAGQKALYLEKQLKAFRDGMRKDPMMSPMAQLLSDDDIANISAYFAAMK